MEANFRERRPGLSEVANEDVAKVIGSNHPQTIMVEHEYVPKNWW
jgi:hypothetical protein